jgi:sarcosine oxidase gamma subunit
VREQRQQQQQHQQEMGPASEEQAAEGEWARVEEWAPERDVVQVRERAEAARLEHQLQQDACCAAPTAAAKKFSVDIMTLVSVAQVCCRACCHTRLIGMLTVVGGCLVGS